MNRIIPAALAALLAAASTAAIAQDQPLAQPPAGGQSVPQTGPGELNETGNVEIQQQVNEDTSQRVLPEVGADQSADALTEQTGVPHDAGVGGTVAPAN